MTTTGLEHAPTTAENPPAAQSDETDSTPAATATEHVEVLVVGAGPAGVSAAVRAAELGASVLVVEADRVGGTCVNTGCVPTRVLARAARLLRETRSADAFGLVVPAPEVVWERTVARVRAVIEQVQGAKDVPGQLAAHGVTLVTGQRATLVGEHVVELVPSGRRIRADQVVLAVGGRSRRLPLPGIELTTVPEAVVDLPRLPTSVAIIGSGNTGSQLVTVFSSFGVAVTLLELADRVLPTADADVSAQIEAAFRRDGVDVRTSVRGVAGIEELPDGRRRVLVDAWGGGTTHVDVETVVVCAGWPANLDGLGLEAAGVERGRAAITADDQQLSSVDHVWVAGDADGRGGLVQAGVADGYVAATNAVRALRSAQGADAAGLPARATTDHSVLPAGGFTDPDYGQVGLTEERARQQHPGAISVTVPYSVVERAVIDGRTTGFLKLVATADARRLLGAHAVGEEALEVVQAVASAMACRADAATLATLEYAYPTYTSIIGLAAVALLRAAGRDELLARAYASTSASEIGAVGGVQT